LRSYAGYSVGNTVSMLPGVTNIPVSVKGLKSTKKSCHVYVTWKQYRWCNIDVL